MEQFLRTYWPALVPVVLGLVGIYLLLPRPRRTPRVLGALLGALALVLAGWLLVRNETRLAETVLFYAFSALAILGGALMLSQRNPVHAALSFALVVLSTCGLFLLLAAPFLMAATIIVYAGAIVVTFLFVIMLAQQAGLTSADQRSREPLAASLAGFIFMGVLLCVLEKTYDTRDIDAVLARVKQVADAKSAETIKQVLGDPEQQPVQDRKLAFLEEIRKTGFDPARAENAESYWAQKPMDVAKLKALFQEIYDHGLKARNQRGGLESKVADATVKLSPFSGPPPAVPLPNGKTTHELPAQNVAGLGRSLFTDYLLPVELAGTLLLVASIGAIAIAGRRTEGLR
jgi:NADH-quinone oxidoreductase subunit J